MFSFRKLLQVYSASGLLDLVVQPDDLSEESI
jgi:hypothetical protein